MMLESSDDDEDDVTESGNTLVIECPVSHSEAFKAFEKCLLWLRYQPEVSACNLATFSLLQDIAASKHLSGLKQTKISSFF